MQNIIVTNQTDNLSKEIEFQKLFLMLGNELNDPSDEFQVDELMDFLESVLDGTTRYKMLKGCRFEFSPANMQMNCYIKRPCGICQKMITANGLAMISHLRWHVRMGDLVEKKFNGIISFHYPDDTLSTMIEEKEWSRTGNYF